MFKCSTKYLLHICPKYNRKFAYFTHIKLALTSEFMEGYGFQEYNLLYYKGF